MDGAATDIAPANKRKLLTVLSSLFTRRLPLNYHSPVANGTLCKGTSHFHVTNENNQQMRSKVSWILYLFAVTSAALIARAQQPASPQSPAAPPNLKIVKLLWKAQPTGAATALEKAIDQGVTRREVEELKPHLIPLSELFTGAMATGSQDPRWVASVAALSIIGDETGQARLKQAVTQLPSSITLGSLKRELLLRVWFATEPVKAKEYVQQVIAKTHDTSSASQPENAWLEVVVLRGLEADKTATTESLLARWGELPRSVQLAAIEPLTQTAGSMKQLVAVIESGRIAKDLLNTNQLLKWTSAKDPELQEKIAKVWGKLRSADDTNRKQVVTNTLKLLTSGKSGNPVAGEAHFKRICFQCHKLHGEGMDVGPDITANGRGSFEQLVSNVMDPSLVIGQAFTAKTILTTDGRVLAGLVAAEDPKRLTLKVQGGKLIELDREEDIDEIKESEKSLMPDGIEQQMSEQELLDLFAYLCLTKSLTAPENGIIPGTPEKLIK